MTTQRRRGQTSFDDWFAFGGIPKPEQLMDPVLKQIDPILDDVALVDVVFALAKRHKQSARTGRPSTPAEVVLRLLVLKHLRSWSYEQLQWEVTGNFVYRRFCVTVRARTHTGALASNRSSPVRCSAEAASTGSPPSKSSSAAS
ncbi:MAG TPA: transposase [Kofleriaceae bacterium]